MPARLSSSCAERSRAAALAAGVGVSVVVMIGCGGAAKPSPATTAPASSAAPTTSATPSASAPSSTSPSASASMGSTTAWCPSGMASIPGGTYTLGATKTSAMVAPYCLDVTEVTVTAYEKCVDVVRCTKPNAYVKQPGSYGQFCNWKHPEGRGDHPINSVDWNQATRFCAWRGARLPTEAEWEWAARSGDKAWTYPWGDSAPTEQRVNGCGSECVRFWTLDTLYNANDGFAETAPVGTFPKGDNRWGVQDLSGNVREWTATISSANLPDRVLRGGGWNDYSAMLFFARIRQERDQSTRDSNLGFRCAKTP